MANPPKPWKAEYAKSARSSCKTCKNNIDKETLRLGKMVQSTHFDGFMPLWNHAGCILKKANQIKFLDDVEGLELLRWEDQQKIRKYVENIGPSDVPSQVVNEYGVEVSQTSRATCRCCNQKIMKGELRIYSKPDGQGAKGLAWHHANCFMESSPTFKLEKLSGRNNLSSSEQAALKVLSPGKEIELQEDKEYIHQATSKGGAKRKRAKPRDHNSKYTKGKSDVPDKNTNNFIEATELESQLEAQSKELWALKDNIKKHVTTAELREMLEINGQDSTGSELDLREHCADGMLFGALSRCPLCSGCLRYSGGMYKCHGYISAWSKCSYSTTEPERIKEKWKIPDETSNEYLSKWYKLQKTKKPVRILPPPSSSTSSSSQAINRLSQSSNGEKLGDLKVVFTRITKELMEEWKTKIKEAGGQVHNKIKKDTNCLIVNGLLDDKDAEVRMARRMRVPIVREDYLVDCFKKQKKLPFDMYKVEAVGETRSMVTVKVKGRSAVHESSGLQDSGHILEDRTSIYNTTLSMSDLSTGINSYYILQIIQDDKGSGCYVFRKWGRVGNDKIGGSKLEEMSNSDAIEEFKHLFLEKTGNSWETWEQKKNFQKQPGRFFPLDIDYGVNKDVSNKKTSIDENSRLAPPLLELMKMLFNVETYRAAMMEFEINMAEMPLGKLSKSNIQKGFEALTEIQNLLNSNAYESSLRETLIVDASNRFFTLIPSIHPHVIRDEDNVKTKVKILEALQDIEIASKLVGFDDDNDDSLDEKYERLRCDISPLPHDTEDYRLIEKYLRITHAPTHMDWALELEEVFSLEREGEFDKFTPYREKLGNRMLLWHGSRLTNFVGILRQGLRIAPPEAPPTGYMFGKGVYFADLVSKSAQYCYTDRKNPVGLMLLSEVALGGVYELKNAKYMDKPPRGKHSTKGLGMKIPDESEYIKWRDEVVVPAGKPVSSKVKTSGLMYNEYIVYNTAQVKMQFLLKVRFHHKR